MWCRVASSNIRHKEVSRLKRWNSKWSDKSQGSKSFSSFLFYRYHLHINVFLFIYFGDASCCKCPSRSLRSSRQSSSELHSDRPWLKVSEKDKKSKKEKHENRKANKCWNFQGILVKVQTSILSNKWPSLMASMPKKRKEDRGYTQAPKAGEYASLTNVDSRGL